MSRSHGLVVALLAACGPTRAVDSAGDDGSSTTATTGGSSPTTTSAETTGNDGACDVWQQDCPEGQKCVPWPLVGDEAFVAAKCVPLAAEVVDDICLTQP